MSKQSRVRRAALEWSLVLLIVCLTLALYMERRDAGTLVASAERIVKERDKANTELEHLSYFFRSQAAHIGSPFAGGIDVVGDTAIQLVRPHDGLYYAIQTSCPACSRNFPFIERLRRESPETFGVFILSFTDSASVLREYALEQRLASAVLAQLAGGITELFPGYGTPFAIAVLDGCIVLTAAGEFSPSEQREFEILARERPVRRSEPPTRMKPVSAC